MSKFIEFGPDDSIEVQCHDGDEAIIILGPEPGGLRLFGNRHELHAFIIEADRQLTILNGGIFSRRK